MFSPFINPCGHCYHNRNLCAILKYTALPGFSSYIYPLLIITANIVVKAMMPTELAVY
jgi:hypothetical protein